jgi:hypothetical protein
LEAPRDLEKRFATGRAAAAEFGVHLVDWIMCDDIHLRGMRITLEDPDDWWGLLRTKAMTKTVEGPTNLRSRRRRLPWRSLLGPDDAGGCLLA